MSNLWNFTLQLKAVPDDMEAFARKMLECFQSLGYGTLIDTDHPVWYLHTDLSPDAVIEEHFLVSYEAVLEYAVKQSGSFTLWKYLDDKHIQLPLENALDLQLDIDLEQKYISYGVLYRLHPDSDIIPDLINLFHLVCHTFHPLYGYTFDEDEIAGLIWNHRIPNFNEWTIN